MDFESDSEGVRHNGLLKNPEIMSLFEGARLQPLRKLL